MRWDSIAGIDRAIEAHAQPAGRVVAIDLAGRGAESAGVFGIDAAFDGAADETHVVLGDAQGRAVGDADLFAHEVDGSDHLGDGMLDLQARIHLDEVEFSALVEIFHRAYAQIAEFLDRRGGDGADFGALGVIQRGRGRFFHHLLVAALQRAIAFAQMDDIAVAVGDDLDFDVARLRQIFF